MSNLVKIAVVTGSNKGIGYAIVKGLAREYPGKVYLTGWIFYVLYSFIITILTKKIKHF